MRLTAIIIILTIQYSYGQDTLYLDTKWNATNKKLATYYRIDKKESGLFFRKDFYSKGNQLQMKGSFQSVDPEVKVGPFEYYHANGKLKHTGEFVANKEIGEHIWYFENGQIEAMENYKEGKLNGEFKEYHKNGKLSTITSFLNGLQDGLTKYYREDGSLHSEGLFNKGYRDGLWNYFDENGKSIGTNEFKTDYVIPEANMFLKLANSEWGLTEKKEGDLTQYYFKRTSITDKNGKEIIPAIMVFIEDASKYEQDVTLYSIWKQRPFKEKGVKTEKILTQDNEDYPLTYKNAYFIECSYKQNELDHIFYMIYIINKDNKGIQVFLDMTKDIADDYISEFWTTIKSIREQ